MFIFLGEAVKPAAGCEIVDNNNYGRISFEQIGWFSHDESFSVAEYELEIAQEKTWNAAFRDWLLDRTRLISKFIPDSVINDVKICLFGTKYQKNGREFIEYLFYKDSSWLTGIQYLDQKMTPDFVIPYFVDSSN